jgi:hypothetical protein
MPIYCRVGAAILIDCNPKINASVAAMSLCHGKFIPPTNASIARNKAAHLLRGCLQCRQQQIIHWPVKYGRCYCSHYAAAAVPASTLQ